MEAAAVYACISIARTLCQVKSRKSTKINYLYKFSVDLKLIWIDFVNLFLLG